MRPLCDLIPSVFGISRHRRVCVGVWEGGLWRGMAVSRRDACYHEGTIRSGGERIWRAFAACENSSFSQGVYVDFLHHLSYVNSALSVGTPCLWEQTAHGETRCCLYVGGGQSSLHEEHEAEIKPLEMTVPVEISKASESRGKAVPFREAKSSPQL